eukprot:941651-Alexandrium_andersonii.AAC.1
MELLGALRSSPQLSRELRSPPELSGALRSFPELSGDVLKLLRAKCFLQAVPSARYNRLWQVFVTD